MKTLIVLFLYGILFLMCWPFAVMLLLAWPFLWLLSIPFRIVAMALEGLLAFVRAVLFLPARLLGTPNA